MEGATTERDMHVAVTCLHELGLFVPLLQRGVEARIRGGTHRQGGTQRLRTLNITWCLCQTGQLHLA
ncbi:hypothetical protein ACIQVC_40405 [Streptomyces sp. NPDC101112]|uniref:hypothetical protein n=1 Tax=Streptomyces sp. NPDC101112 TaxID=3366105 RepID=UPI003815A7ED